MPYDHSTKVGNQGDLLKHTLLYAVVQQQLKAWPKDKVFHYADTHAGRPLYVLPAGGNWQYGIGAFSRLKGISKQRRNKAERHRIGIMRDYFDGIIGRKVTSGTIYPGSTGIVFRLIRQYGVETFRLDLWEKDIAAADDLTRYFYPWGEETHIHPSDGYTGILNTSSASLVLLDPPDLTPDRITDCIKHLQNQKVSFICWTPRPSDKNSSVESPASVSFINDTRKVADCFPVQWTKWRKGQSSGCCLTVSSDLSSLAKNVISKCVELMSEVRLLTSLPEPIKNRNEQWQ